jgi:hypothetical protein
MHALLVVCQTCPRTDERRRARTLFTACIPGEVIEQCKRDYLSDPQRAEDLLTRRLVTILGGAGSDVPGLAFTANTTVNTTSIMYIQVTIFDIASQLLHPEPWLA